MFKQVFIAIGCCAILTLPASAQVSTGSPSLSLYAQSAPRSALEMEISQLQSRLSQDQSALNAAQADQAAAKAQLAAEKSPTVSARTQLNQRLQRDANLVKQQTADITSSNGWLSYWNAEKQTRHWNKDQNRLDYAVYQRQAATRAQDLQNQLQTAQGARANRRMFRYYPTEPLYDGWTSIPLPCVN